MSMWVPVKGFPNSNLVASEHARGKRKCRACNQARSFAQKRNIAFDPRVADDKYAAVARGR